MTSVEGNQQRIVAEQPAIGLLIINEAELDLVQSHLPDEIFVSLLDQCLIQIDRHIEDLERQRPDPDWVRNMAHSMIGSAGVIGAEKVVALARRMEAATAANACSEVGELIEQTIAAWAEAGEMLKLRRNRTVGDAN